MIVYEAPQKEPTHAVFLAGGITDCPDWQRKVIKGLEKREAHHLEVFNPRRKGFNVHEPGIGEEQIQWEHEFLDKADTIAFWFPKETLCPITLFELGKFLTKRDKNGMLKNLIIGCHPKYQRKFDVEVQVKIERPNLEIVHSLEKHIDAISYLTQFDKLNFSPNPAMIKSESLWTPGEDAPDPAKDLETWKNKILGTKPSSIIYDEI